MLDRLIAIDRAIFLFINQSLANPITDFFMPFITNDNVLRVIFAAVLVCLLIFGKSRFVWVIVFSLLVVAVTDQTSSALLKPLFGRLRPCRVMEVHLLVGCGSGFSFPSSHAANLFGQALFFGLLYRKYFPVITAFALPVGLSRIFVGVHYPLDIIAGMILGGLEGAALALVVIKIGAKLKPKPYIIQ